MSFHGSHNSSIMSQNNLLTTPTRPTFSRYSLANSWVTSPTSQERKNSLPTNISTRIDSSSPGYSSRLVHYNEEQERSTPKRTGKYDKLGVFPIVHFFKKDLPVLKRKSSPANSSDLAKYNTPEHNRMLLERIITSSPGNHYTPSYRSETNTKSVLDALKEISRKRIHPDADEFIVNEDGKRSYGDYNTGASSRKRLKQNCLQMDDMVVNSQAKLGPMNEWTASHSSMIQDFTQKPEKRKHLETITTTVQPTVTPVKCVDVETQTLLLPQLPVPPPVTITENIHEKEATIEIKETKPKKTSPVIVFDETPLEKMRKKRLTALVGSPSLSTPQSKQATEGSQAEDTSKVEKPLISILSGSTKSPHKANKHVTFEIPEIVDPGTDNVTVIKTPPGTYTVTKTSAAVVMPIVSASIAESTLSPKSGTSPKHEIPVSVVFNSGSSISTPSQFTSPPPLKPDNPQSNFQNPISVSNVLSLPTSLPPAEPIGRPVDFMKKTLELPNPTIPQTAGFKFELKEQIFTETPKSVPFSLPTFNQMSQPAGVKENPSGFNLTTNKPRQEMANGNNGGLNQQFGVSSVGSFGIDKNQSTGDATARQSFANKVPTTNFLMPPTSLNNPPLYAFGANKNVNSTVASTSAATTMQLVDSPPSTFTNKNILTNSSVFDTTVSSSTPFSFGGPTNPPPPFPNSNNFVTSNSSMPPPFANSNNFVTSNSSMPPAFPSTNNFVTSSSPMPPFSNSNNFVSSNSTMPPPFPNSNNFVTSNSSMPSPFPNSSNNFVTSSSSMPPPFPNSSNNFITSNASMPPPFPNSGNNFAASSSMPVVFVDPGNASKVPSSETSFFNPPNVSFNKKSVFGSGSNVSGFGSDPGKKSMFGQNTATSFGTTTPNFGAADSTVPNTNTFGNVAPTQPNTNTFGNVAPTQPNTNTFGNVAPTQPNTNTFGNVAPTQSNVFGNASTAVSVPLNRVNFVSPNFAANQKSSFGNGSNNVAKNNFNRSFGAPNVSPFTVSNSTNTTPFSTMKPTFNTGSNTFSSVTNSSQVVPSTFGSPVSFAKSDGPTTAEVAPFGTTTSTFGSNQFSGAPQAATSQSDLFTFGTANTNKPAIFSFGTNKPPEQPAFNFQTQSNSAVLNANNNKIFGGGSTSSAPNALPMQSNAMPMQPNSMPMQPNSLPMQPNSMPMQPNSLPMQPNSLAMQQFNTQPSGANMFNIGTGGSQAPNRFRTQHKGKRRT